MSGRYEYLEHTSDLRFRAYGRELGECFGNAAHAMSAALTDPSAVEGTVKKHVSLEAESLVGLMHDWLSEILFLFEMQGLIFSSFAVSVSGSDDKYALEAECLGETYDKGKHVIDADIKAVTFHGLKVEKEGDMWVAEVLCDI